MTHTSMCQGSIPSCWNGGEAHHIINESSFEEEDRKISFVDERSSRQYVPRVHIPTGKGRPFCVDFYTHVT